MSRGNRENQSNTEKITTIESSPWLLWSIAAFSWFVCLSVPPVCHRRMLLLPAILSKCGGSSFEIESARTRNGSACAALLGGIIINPELLESAKKLFFILLGVDVAVTAVVGLNAFSTVGALRAIQSGTRGVDQSLLSSLEFWDWFSRLIILTMIGVGLGLVKWLNSCYRFAKGSLGATGFKNERWTAVGWIIPIFNLFKPYQIINEIYKAGASTYTASEDWKKESGSGLLLAWWILWASTHFIGTIISKQFLRGSMRDDGSLQHAIFTTELQVWACVISLVIAGLWFWVANMLTQRLFDRSAMTVVNATAGQFANATENTSSHTPIDTLVSNSATSSANSIASIPVVCSGASSMTQQVQSEAATAHIESHITSQVQTVVDEDRIYTAIANELETGVADKGLWTRLFAECGGDDKQIRVLYIQARFAKLLALEEEKQKISLAEQQAAAIEQARLGKMPLYQKLSTGLIRSEDAERASAGMKTEFLNAVRYKPSTDVERMVLERPILLALKNSDGDTCLHIATREMRIGLIEFLVAEGAYVNARNNWGETASDIARFQGLPNLIAVFDKIDSGQSNRSNVAPPIVAQQDDESAGWILMAAIVGMTLLTAALMLVH